ncbi:hypothetical protein, partial [Staphylococcus aureus]|uniref:hypothetical protein n=1 Tax=Staphylococcus aureus TaxID=1280 RepID=UPI0038B3354C
RSSYNIVWFKVRIAAIHFFSSTEGQQGLLPLLATPRAKTFTVETLVNQIHIETTCLTTFATNYVHSTQNHTGSDQVHVPINIC